MRRGGVRAILVYKTVKASLQLGTAAVMTVLLPFGLPDEVRELGDALKRHGSHAWASTLAALLESGSTRHGVLFAIAVLGLDGLLTGIEAWALRAGHWWGPWLVVVATGMLLPFEAVALVRAPHLSRALLLLANLAIVVYLGRRAWRERRGAG